MKSLFSFFGFIFFNLNLLAEIKLPVVVPLAEPIPYVIEKHGDSRTDEFYWLKDRTNPKVIDYLKSENRYQESILKPTEKLQKKLYLEMKSRMIENDSSYPVKNGPYFYYTRYEKQKQYPIFARKTHLKAKEEIILNVNTMARGHKFYNASYVISPNHEIAALIFDDVGRRFYNLKFKNLKTNKYINLEIKSVANNVAWALDSKTIFYVKQDANTLRWNQVYRLNLDSRKSELIYEEHQNTYEVSLSTSLTKKYIYINSSSTLSNETRIISADSPLEPSQLLLAREKEHEFTITDDENYFYILTNKNSRDFKILRTPIQKPDFKTAEVWLSERKNIHIDNFLVFKNFVAVAIRENGLTQLEIYNKKNVQAEKISFQDSAYTVEFGVNVEFESECLRYIYYSLRKPASIYDYNVKLKNSSLLKTKKIPNYNEELYVSKRIFISSRDGVQIPVSLLMKKNTPLDGSAPLLIYGYGAYGSNMDPWFNSNLFSLIDRGYIYAIAHVRGGGEMGRAWTEAGRLLNKTNTFNDFIDSTEFLINHGYAHSKKVFALGGSAGGLLMGAIANLRPDLYKGIIAEVPFVDVLTTMLDETIPLTTAEYDEWGNPNEKTYYNYIRTYSPYDNIKPQAYPHILITTGLHDSQVQYWEPAKWAARLRRLSTSNNYILLKTDMSSGHGGKTGRFDQLKEEALEFAFILEMQKK